MKILELLQLVDNEPITGNMFAGLKDEALKIEMKNALSNMFELVGNIDIPSDSSELQQTLDDVLGIDKFSDDQLWRQAFLCNKCVVINNRYSKSE